MFLPRSRRSIRASVFQANFWTTNDLSSSSRWPEVARSDSCASTFSRIETFPFCPFNHYLQYPFHTAPSSTPLSHVSFITHPTTATQYITFNFRLSFVLSKHHSIKSTNVYNSSIHVITYTSYFGNNKGKKKNHSRRVKREKSQREIKNFSTRYAPFTFFTPGFWTHVQKLVYMSPMELSIVRVYTPFHVFTSLLFLSFVKQ